MRVRQRYLPPGWYPVSDRQTREAVEGMLQGVKTESRSACAGVVPHAGWEFSGSIALEVFSRLLIPCDTIVIIGGHLSPSDGILCAFEEGYETPLGVVGADLDLLKALSQKLEIREDRHADNTVEIQLPFIRYLFPGVKALGMRASPSAVAIVLGKTLAGVSQSIGKKVVVVGSTDLTHYGAGYAFNPAGSGERAMKWVRDVNDRRFIESLLSMDADAAIARAEMERSACSAGGAVAAMSFAREKGCARGRLVKYATSYEVHPSDSFVGYAAVVFPLSAGASDSSNPGAPCG
jgi:AmmeMemoRadiSam system protein B